MIFLSFLLCILVFASAAFSAAEVDINSSTNVSPALGTTRREEPLLLKARRLSPVIRATQRSAETQDDSNTIPHTAAKPPRPPSKQKGAQVESQYVPPCSNNNKRKREKEQTLDIEDGWLPALEELDLIELTPEILDSLYHELGTFVTMPLEGEVGGFQRRKALDNTEKVPHDSSSSTSTAVGPSSFRGDNIFSHPLSPRISSSDSSDSEREEERIQKRPKPSFRRKRAKAMPPLAEPEEVASRSTQPSKKADMVDDIYETLIGSSLLEEFVKESRHETELQEGQDEVAMGDSYPQAKTQQVRRHLMQTTQALGEGATPNSPDLDLDNIFDGTPSPPFPRGPWISPILSHSDLVLSPSLQHLWELNAPVAREGSLDLSMVQNYPVEGREEAGEQQQHQHRIYPAYLQEVSPFYLAGSVHANAQNHPAEGGVAEEAGEQQQQQLVDPADISDVGPFFHADPFPAHLQNHPAEVAGQRQQQQRRHPAYANKVSPFYHADPLPANAQGFRTQLAHMQPEQYPLNVHVGNSRTRQHAIAYTPALPEEVEGGQDVFNAENLFGGHRWTEAYPAVDEPFLHNHLGGNRFQSSWNTNQRQTTRRASPFLQMLPKQPIPNTFAGGVGYPPRNSEVHPNVRQRPPSGSQSLRAAPLDRLAPGLHTFKGNQEEKQINDDQERKYRNEREKGEGRKGQLQAPLGTGDPLRVSHSSNTIHLYSNRAPEAKEFFTPAQSSFQQAFAEQQPFVQNQQPSRQRQEGRGKRTRTEKMRNRQPDFALATGTFSDSSPSPLSFLTTEDGINRRKLSHIKYLFFLCRNLFFPLSSRPELLDEGNTGNPTETIPEGQRILERRKRCIKILRALPEIMSVIEKIFVQLEELKEELWYKKDTLSSPPKKKGKDEDDSRKGGDIEDSSSRSSLAFVYQQQNVLAEIQMRIKAMSERFNGRLPFKWTLLSRDGFNYLPLKPFEAIPLIINKEEQDAEERHRGSKHSQAKPGNHASSSKGYIQILNFAYLWQVKQQQIESEGGLESWDLGLIRSDHEFFYQEVLQVFRKSFLLRWMTLPDDTRAIKLSISQHEMISNDNMEHLLRDLIYVFQPFGFPQGDTGIPLAFEVEQELVKLGEEQRNQEGKAPSSPVRKLSQWVLSQFQLLGSGANRNPLINPSAAFVNKWMVIARDDLERVAAAVVADEEKQKGVRQLGMRAIAPGFVFLLQHISLKASGELALRRRTQAMLDAAEDASMSAEPFGAAERSLATSSSVYEQADHYSRGWENRMQPLKKRGKMLK